MTEPSSQRPVPGPPRPAPSTSRPPPAVPVAPVIPAEPQGPGEDRFADLDRSPVSEHVAVFEAEHGRLQRELGTIDQL